MTRWIRGVTIRGASLTLWLVGVVVGGISCRDEQSLGPTEPGSVANANPGPALAGAAPAPLSFYQVSGGADHTCGVTMDSRLYCWGYNGSGQLGDGTTVERSRPVPVATTLRFREVTTGNQDTCAVTTEYRAYCWGDNSFGQLGDGTAISRLKPVAVAGGRQYRQVSLGFYHTCAVGYTDSRGYCWGDNSQGQLGDGTTTYHLKPVPVAATLHFRRVSAGGVHTCGATTDNRAFCWGNNGAGQIGDRSEARLRLKPSLVADGHQFSQVDAGWDHTCAVTTGKRAYCWGNGREGEIGNGRSYLSFWPRAVAGGLSFERVTAGYYHSCGETTLNRAYCWGYNTSGQLGDGTGGTLGARSLTPVAVAGGHFFSQVSAGDAHTCGRTDAAVAYCWGSNYFGELGDGTTVKRPSPVPVAGPM